MAFSLGSRIVTNRPLADYLKETVQYFKAIELHADPRFLSPNFAFTTAEKKTIRIYQEKYGFKLTMHAPFVSLGASNQEERALSINKLLTAMHTAAELGIELIVFHPCTLEPSTPYPELCRREEESIAGLLPEAKKLGVVLAMENMPSDPNFHPNTCDGSRFQELLWLFMEPEFGLTIDVGHAIQAKVSLESLLKMDRVRHFHLHDNDRCLDRHLPILNNLPWWEQLIKQINKKFPDAVGIFEMNQLEDQVTSYKNLSKSIKSKPAPKKRLPEQVS